MRREIGGSLPIQTEPPADGFLLPVHLIYPAHNSSCQSHETLVLPGVRIPGKLGDYECYTDE